MNFLNNKSIIYKKNFGNSSNKKYKKLKTKWINKKLTYGDKRWI